MAVTVYALASFAKTSNGGNPAGVVLEADDFSDEQMLKIANTVGFSETAFVQKSDKATHKVRFFTPKAEVDLCGHATIATFALLKMKGIIANGTISQETKAGVLNIKVEDDLIYMNQVLPKYYNILDKAEIADCLAIAPNDCQPNLPVQIVSTGLKDIIMPVNDISILYSISPDFKKITELSKKHDVVGIHVFCLEAKYGGTAHCRNFAPRYDIDEEAATGTSNGALACYLYKYGVADKKNPIKLSFEQGYLMDKPSEILVRLNMEGNKISEVLVGGRAIVLDKLEI